ncbi:MAG: hypothetical protein NTW19_17640 [Planctomycetota bacterium]|nr:hypothetical protein [Planctomycetota bacterium]
MADHRTLGTFFIGNSYPMQHWNVPDDKNPAKAALNSGQVDVLTLSPNRTVPDPGIDLFADLAFEKNPAGRVMIQFSWFPRDNHEEHTTIADYDKPDAAELKAMGQVIDDYLVKQREQVRAINARHGREFVTLVPIGPALIRLRQEILAGKVPGLTKQSQLFRDPGGHPSQALRNLVAYCWFAAMYHKSPVGMTALDKPGVAGKPGEWEGDGLKELNRHLQKLAWETITTEPLSGVANEAAVR